MRFAGPISLGSFLLIGTVPIARPQPPPPDARTQTAVCAGSPGPTDTYIQKSEEELDEWQAKLLRFDDETKARAHEDGAAARADLLAALDKAKAGAYKLQTVAADGLEDAKVAYEKATSELRVRWQRVAN